MFQKNKFCPAFACGEAMDKPSWINKKHDGISKDSYENDFKSFSSGSSSGSSRAPKNRRKKTVTLEVPGKTLAIAAAVILSIVLLLVLIISLASSRTDAIAYKDNAFAAYEATDGTYRVVMNGKATIDIFDKEVKLVEAKDSSFAYVEATVNGATNVYMLDGGKLKLLCEGVDEVLAYSEYVPGVVYKYGDRVEYTFDGLITSLARNNDTTPKNFVISPNGRCIAYTIRNKNDSNVYDLYVYTTDMSGPEAKSNATASTVPVSISNDGKYIVAYTQNGEANELYLIVGADKYKINDIEGSFYALTCANSDATEIVFTTKIGADYRTYVYNCTELKKGATAAHAISNGYAVPQIVDPEVCTPETFKKCYFQDAKASLTLYINKKYDSIKVSDYLGQIDSEARFLYIINEQRDNMLIQVELLGEKFGKDSNRSSAIATDVKEFIITEKGNIYYTDGYGDLYFYKLAKGKASRITNDVTDLLFYTYANELYFEKVDSADAHGTYRTSEGSDHHSFEFGKTKLTKLPEITNTYSKKSYACYLDETTDNYVLFYTSNGRSFRRITECNKIIATHKNYLEKLVEDVVS